MIKFDLQFFADGGDDDGTDTVHDDNGSTTDGSDNQYNEVDVSALAEIISDKDKQIEQLQKDVAELKRSNAQLIVQVNSGTTQGKKKSFEENLLDMVGAKPRKE